MKSVDCTRGLPWLTALFLTLSLLPPATTSVGAVGGGTPSLQQFIDAGKIPPDIKTKLARDGQTELLIIFDESDVQAAAGQLRASGKVTNDSAGIIREKARLYSRKKNRVLANISPQNVTLLKDYAHFPVMHVKVNESTLAGILSSPDVAMVAENRAVLPFLAQSLPLIGAPQALSAGATGSGTAVAVLDTGLNYTLSAFGNCTAPGTPSTCKVSYVQDFAPSDGSLDNNGHGTNVAGIVAGVAPDAKLIGLDVFSADGYAYYSDILTALDWVLANKDTYNIVSVNLSLGSGKYTSPCAFDGLAIAVGNLKSAGIATVIASGNEKYINGIAAPACIPDALSVGAVYDANVGSRSWSVCSDYSTAADRVACFSNSASFLTMLAPGALISAGITTMAGTSQAAPHVAGAVAVLKGRYGSLTVDNVVTRFTGTGVSVNDSRNSIVKPRLDLYSALQFPSIAGDPAGYDFGTVAAGGSSYIKTFSITNAGMADLSIGTITINPEAGTSLYDFIVLSDLCSGGSLAPAGTCTLGVRMIPQAVGGKGALLAIPSNDPFNPALNLSLSGIAQLIPTCTNSPVRIAGAVPVYYDSIQVAYGNAADGAILQLQEVDFSGDITFDREVMVTVSGGYDCEYTSNSSSTRIYGKLGVLNGTVKVDKVRVM